MSIAVLVLPLRLLLKIRAIKVAYLTLLVWASVATKIENGPKTNMKILQFLKMDQRQIRRIFVNSKILQRSLKIANSSNILNNFSQQ